MPKYIHFSVLAICSPNFVPVGKGRDWKTLLFFMVPISQKKCQAEGEAINKILSTLILCGDCTFLKARGLEILGRDQANFLWR